MLDRKAHLIRHFLSTPFLLASVIASPSRLSNRQVTASAPAPHCFYSYGCSQPTQCIASPNPAWCQQSIDAVCRASSTQKTPATPESYTWITYDTGPSPVGPFTGNSLASQQDHCLAILIASEDVTTFPSYEACQAAFKKVGGCAVPTQQGYNATCVGGSLNLPSCVSEAGSLEVNDSRTPAYVLGAPQELRFIATPHAPGAVRSKADVQVFAKGQLSVGPYELP